MKKKLAALLAVVMVLSMGLTAFAADSPKAEAPEGVSTDTKDVTVTKVTDEKAVKEAETRAAAINKNAKILASFDVTGPVGTPITFKIPAVKKGANIVLLHQKNDGTWERIKPDVVGDGYIVATFSSYSNVFVLELPAVTNDGKATGTSPKTGYLF